MSVTRGSLDSRSRGGQEATAVRGGPKRKSTAGWTLSLQTRRNLLGGLAIVNRQRTKITMTSDPGKRKDIDLARKIRECFSPRVMEANRLPLRSIARLPKIGVDLARRNAQQ